MEVSRDLDSFILLFAVEPPSDLKFKILNENTVQMSWRRPSSQIRGYRIQVTSDTGALCTYYSICISFDQLWVTDLLTWYLIFCSRWFERFYSSSLGHKHINLESNSRCRLFSVNQFVWWCGRKYPYPWTINK